MMKLLCAAAACGVAAVFGAPAANATTDAETEYLNDLSSARITGDPSGLIADGYAVCSAVANGASPHALAAEYDRNSDGLTRAQAEAAVSLALRDLCPEG